MKFLVINGPNLNLLGKREPGIYGDQSYDALCAVISDHAAANNSTAEFFQSNHEGALVDAIQQAYFDKVDGIMLHGAKDPIIHGKACADAVKALAPKDMRIFYDDVSPIYGGADEALYDVGIKADEAFREEFMRSYEEIKKQ